MDIKTELRFIKAKKNLMGNHKIIYKVLHFNQIYTKYIHYYRSLVTIDIYFFFGPKPKSNPNQTFKTKNRNNEI